MARFSSLYLLMLLSACMPSGSLSPAVTPQSMMVGVAKQVQACWFRKKDPAVKGYTMASELDSYSGKPRILIVPRSNPGGLPKLVAQAERSGGKVRFSTFGPLLDTSDGPRLEASLRSWSRGSRSC